MTVTPRPDDDVASVHTLRDGTRVLVRAVTRSDRDELARRYEELSAASRRLRFGSAPDHLSDRLLDHLVDLDYVDRFAIAAIAVDEPDLPGIGIARYSRLHDDPSGAEAAVTVLDRCQQRGIGTLLLQQLAEVARAHGIGHFVGTVAWENGDLLDALRAHGAVVVPDEPGVASVRVEL